MDNIHKVKNMYKIRLGFILFIVFSTAFIESSKACTSFCLRHGKHIVLCKNLDWDLDNGIIVINKRGVHKKAFITNGDKSIEWVSKFGSVTFNHLGKEFPLGGINEKGLAIEEMNYYWTQYPEPDNRPCLNELQWIQYQLDNFSSVDEVVKSDSTLRISPFLFKIHFLVSDKLGNVATIEFLKGKMVCHVKDKIIVPVLTNHKYDESVAALQNYRGFGGNKNIPQNYESLNNFIRTASLIRNYSADIPIIDYSFNILSSVSNKIDTQWSVVYDLSQLKIFYKTKRYPKLKSIDLKKIDFSNKGRSLVIDINNKNEDEINSYFIIYKTEINEKLISSVFSGLKELGEIDQIPDKSFIKNISKYPETCKFK
jgi:penicillin V acylase-like amidase (Ntn superfamily)